MAKWKLNEKAIKEQIAQAKERTRIADTIELRAVEVYYDQGSYRVVVILSNDTDFRFSPSSVQELAGASPDEIAQVEVSPSGRTLRWKKLDADLSLPGLMMGIFGTKMWMAHLGREGGQATSPVKAAAARLNGLKGGRPKKAVDVDRIPARAGTWKAKSVSTSPARRLASKSLSRKATKSPRTLKVSASALAGHTKTHGKASRTLKKSERSVVRCSDKKRKK